MSDARFRKSLDEKHWSNSRSWMSSSRVRKTDLTSEFLNEILMWKTRGLPIRRHGFARDGQSVCWWKKWMVAMSDWWSTPRLDSWDRLALCRFSFSSSTSSSTIPDINWSFTSRPVYGDGHKQRIKLLSSVDYALCRRYYCFIGFPLDYEARFDEIFASLSLLRWDFMILVDG